MSDSVMHTYSRLPVQFNRGQGCYLFDTDDQRYTDALSGIGTCNIGHCHPAVTNAISQQANTLVHTSNLYHIASQQALAEKLTNITGMSSVFFANSGAESNEAAIKIARLYGSNKGFSVPKIIVMENSFHGRTMATLSATGNDKIKQGFSPLLDGFLRAPYNDTEAVRTLIEQHDDIAAILVEPIQGEGGVRIPGDSYLSELQKLCDIHDLLLMLDEVQTGNGRTGKYFAFQHHGIQPDVVTTAKGLGNGVPIGACIAGGRAADVFHPGNHGSTFGGNPLACSAALAVIKTIQQENLVENSRTIGDYINQRFTTSLNDIEGVTEIRNRGMMIGIELATDCAPLVAQALKNKLLINVTAGNVIRLLPPINMTQPQADIIIDTLTPLIRSHLQ